MASSTPDELLNALMEEAELILASFLSQIEILVPTSESLDKSGNVMPLYGQLTLSAGSAPPVPGGATSSPGLTTEGISFPDNERGLRALAKEIKRMITEDQRRGLPV